MRDARRHLNTWGHARRPDGALPRVPAGAQQRDREKDGQGITHDFACTCLVTGVLAPDPFGRIWVANHFPDYQLAHERERCLQSAEVARRLESVVLDSLATSSAT